MNRFVTVFALAAAAATVITASPAEAKVRPVNEGGDTRPCVTYDESWLVNIGMPEHRVQRILDTSGHRVSSHVLDSLHAATHADVGRHVESRSYPVCEGEGAMMIVSFKIDSPKHRVVEAYYQ